MSSNNLPDFGRLLNRPQSIPAALILFILFSDMCNVSTQSCMPLPPKKNSANFSNFSIDYILTEGISEMEGQLFISKNKRSENGQAIFVLGNTGSGKTTTTQIIAGDLSRLHATKSAGSLVIIDDDNRIGAPSTVSKTLVPEYIVHPETGDRFWDCPGFNDNRGSKTDIAAMYFLKYALDRTTQAKFLITTTHASLKSGNRIDFPLLSSHLIRLFTNIEKFNDSMGLLVTRVASFDPETGEDLTDTDLLEQTKEFLQDHIEDLNHQEQRFKAENNKEKIMEIRNQITFVEGLLTEGPNKKGKIFFLRGPRRCGTLSNFPQVVETRNKLTELYNNNLVYSTITPNDFRYSVQASTLRDVEQIYIPQVVETISEIIGKVVGDAGVKFFKHFYEDLSSSDSILSNLEQGCRAITKYLDPETPKGMLSVRLGTFHADFVSNSYFSSAAKLTDLERQLNFFSTIISKEFNISTTKSAWSSPMLLLLNKITTLQRFYIFCNQTEYLMQKTKAQQDLKSYLRRHNNVSLDISNALEMIENTNILQVGQDIRDIWINKLGPADKTYFLNSIRSLLPTLYECIPIPSTEVDESSSKTPKLTTILSEGTAKIESEIARGPQARSIERKAIFILGNSGSGKTTVTQIMAGNLKKLHATFAEGSSLVIIDDDNQIGAPTTRSKTLVPNYVVEQGNSEYVFWDCPGFQDNRGPDKDIAAMYFLRQTLVLTTSAKFLFTVPQSSVTIGNVRDDFDTMATHAVRLIRNIENFSQAIGLIVTKVNSYSNLGYIDDTEILNRTIGFLQSYKNDLVALIASTETERQKQELRDKLAFVEAIVNNTEGIFKPRLAFIRSPTDCGPLDTMPEILDSRNASRNLYKNELTYATISSQNFNISLSSKTTLQVVNDIAPNVYKQIEISTCGIAQHLLNNFFTTFYKMLLTDSGASIAHLHRTHTILNAFLRSEEDLPTISYSTDIKTLHRQLNYELNCQKYAKLFSLEAQLEFYRDVTREDTKIPQLVASNFKCYLDFLEKLSDYSEFYDFCNSTATQLRGYESQEKLLNLQKSNQINFNENNVLHFLFQNGFVKNVATNKFLYFWNDAQLYDKQHLVGLVHDSMPDLTLECLQSQINTSKRKLIVTGRIILVSKAFDKAAWANASCHLAYVKEVQIVAMDTVIFDVDIQENEKEIYVSIIAPVWDVKLFGSNRRQIYLNGAHGIPHSNAASFRNTAKVGATGGDAGSFFGIVEKIINKEKLYINANGGNGGPGQDGANGAPGHNGRSATSSDYRSGRNVKSESANGNVYFPDIDRERRYVLGEYGGRGERGGNGGTGGTPGIPGSVKLVFIKGNINLKKEQISTQFGRGGAPGKGGAGGLGGKHGNSYSCLITYRHKIHSTTQSCGVVENRFRADTGQYGALGHTAMLPVKSPQLYEPWQIIAQYRKTHFGKSFVPEFSLALELSPYVHKSYFPISFAEEVQKMEEEFYTSFQNTNFEKQLVAYYSTFMERVEKFANASHNRLSAGDKLALNEVYTAVLGKVAGIRRQEQQLSVIKTKQYLETTVKKLTALRTAQKDREIQQHAVEYSAKFLDALNEATNHISSTVQPAIEECQKHVEQVNQELYREIQQFLDEARSEVGRQIELKQQAERAAKLRTIMNVIGIAGAATQFLGPAGMAVGSLISTGTSIAQSLAFGPSTPSTSFKIPVPVANTLTSANKAYYENEIKKIKQMSANVVKATSEIDDEKLQYLKQNAIELNSLVKRVEIGVENNNFIDTMRAKKEADELARQMKQSVIDESKKIANAEKSEKRNAKYIQNLVVAMGSVDAVAQLVFDHQSSVSKIKELADAVEQAEQQVKDLEAKKEQFYDEFLPAMESMFNAIETDTNSLKEKSHVSQMVKGWEMKTMLRKMRHFIKQFTTGISVSEEFQVCLDLLDEALTLLLGLYEQMENFKDKIDLANYIANVNKVSTRSTGNRELDLALSKVSIIVQSNLMLEEYQKAKHAFKQWVFPFASHYLYDQHAVYGKHDNLNDVVNLYTKEIEHLQSELAVYQSTTVSRDMSLMYEIFSSDTLSTEPFYVWNNTNWRESIKKLLFGEPIKLKADVDMYDQTNANYFQHKAAIKFKTVELKIKTRNPDLQQKLDQKLKYFRMKLEHTGPSLYKVFGKHYVIGGRPQTYQYSFEKNHNGHVSQNGVQYKVQGGDVDYMLSPYTWWVLQLIDSKPDDNIDFADLNGFVDEIDLELEGEGVYLDETTVSKEDREKLNLDEHYESIDPALIDVQGKEDLYGFC